MIVVPGLIRDIITEADYLWVNYHDQTETFY